MRKAETAAAWTMATTTHLRKMMRHLRWLLAKTKVYIGSKGMRRTRA